MLGWINSNAESLQVGVGMVSALVWVIYLHLLLLAHRRQQKTVILINRGGSRNQAARCLVSNMGAQPLYVLDVIATLDFGDTTQDVRVTDREEMRQDQAGSPSELTNQGPVDSGSFVDIGSFADMLGRAERQLGQSTAINDVDGLTVTVVAASNQARYLVAAERHFRVIADDDMDHPRLVPTQVMARQITSRRERRRIRDMLGNWLDD